MAQHQVDADARGRDIGGQNAFTKFQDVGFRAVDVVFVDGVATVAQLEEVDIAASTAIKHIVARAAVQHIGTGTTIEGIVPGTAGQGLVERGADTRQHIITVTAHLLE